jgi:hypothetical protein
MSKQAVYMPLTRKVTFNKKLEKGQRVQIPMMIRWEFKMEPDQVLKVGITFPNKFKGWQFFYAKMEKAGKIFIPKMILAPWQEEKNDLAGLVAEVTIEPS